MARIFISYKRVDKKTVFELKDKIEISLGEKCWIDLDGIESDAQFVNVIISAINKASIMLFMYSNAHSLIQDVNNDWTIRELNFAQEKGKRIIFINLDKTPLTDWFLLMFGMKQQIDATSKEAVMKLLEDLSKWLQCNFAPQKNEVMPNELYETDSLYGTVLNGKEGRYQVGNYIGKGHTGIVYKGLSLGNKKTVAIKKFDIQGLGGHSFRNRSDAVICSEAIKALKKSFKFTSEESCRFKHPSIVNTFDVVTSDQDVYCIMEYLKGQNLNNYVALKPISERIVVNIILRVACGLDYLHKHSILHCDIKPHNIIWDDINKEAKLIDFSTMIHISDLSSVDCIWFSSAYAAPELLCGGFNKSILNVTLDIYSLGATFFQMLTNKYPPISSDMNNLTSEIKYNLDVLGTTPCLTDIILKAMSPNSKNRYISIKDFISDLSRLNGLHEVPLYPAISEKELHEREQERFRVKTTVKANFYYE